MRRMKERVISGGATFPVIGSYDQVAEKFLQLAEAGLSGMALILVNYVQEMLCFVMKCCRDWSVAIASGAELRWR